MPIQMAFRPDSVETKPIPTKNPSPYQPNRIIVREIDLVINGGAFDFVFKDPDQAFAYTPLKMRAITDEIERTGTYARNTLVQDYHRPLDINLTEPSYVILFLSDNWNWRFCHEYRGVTLGKGVNDTYYNNLKHVLGGVDFEQQIPHNVGSCRIVHFIAAPRAQDPPGFADAFNFNVEIVRPDTNDGLPNTMPIIIDPDVRHPGGSTS